MRLIFRSPSALVLLLLPLFGLANVSDDEGPENGPQNSSIDPFPLPEIHVTARRRQLPSTQPVRVANREDFEAWNSKTVADALTYTPGVNVLVGGSSGNASPWIRGYRDRDIQITYDGIPIGDSLEGAVDLNQVALQRIARIRVLKTAPSVIFGAGAPGGVIVIEPDEALPEGFFSDGEAGFGTDHRRFGRVDLGRGRPGGYWAISAQYDATDNFSVSDDYPGVLNQPPGQRVNSDYRNTSFLAQATFLESPLGSTRFLYNFSDGVFGLPLEAGVSDPDFERILLSRRNTLGFSNAFHYWPLSIKLYLNDYDYELGIYENANYDSPEEIEEAQDRSYGARVYSAWEWAPSSTLVWMASGQSNGYKEPNKAREETREYALALEQQYESANRLSIAAGLIFAHFEQLLEGRSVRSVDPQASVGWRLSEHFDVHASIAQRTRFPKIRELYRNRYGNPNLDEQTSLNTELGVTMRHGAGLRTDLSVFHNRIEGLIERPNRRSIYLNLDEVTYRGLEAQTGGWVTSHHFVRGSVALLDADERLPDGGSRQLRSRPEQVWTMEYRYQFTAGTLLSVNAIHVRGLHDLDADGEYLELKPYWVGDLKLTHPLSKTFSAYLTISNFADDDYQHRYGYPREGRQVMVGLKYRSM